MEEKGHPGLPPYEESLAGRINGAPAAKVVTRNASCSPEAAPPVILGDIVERQPSLASIRPPGAKPTTVKLVDEEGTLLEEIRVENEKVLQQMTTEEILAEQEELKKLLPAKLLQKWSPNCS